MWKIVITRRTETQQPLSIAIDDSLWFSAGIFSVAWHKSDRDGLSENI